jgi:hypothetical protein
MVAEAADMDAHQAYAMLAHMQHPLLKHIRTDEEAMGLAMQAVIRLCEPHVEAANRWLAACVADFPQLRHVRSQDQFRESRDVWADAALLAHALCDPEHPFSLGPEAPVLTCTEDEGLFEVPPHGVLTRIRPGAKAVWSVAQGDVSLLPPNGTPHTLPPGSKLTLAAGDGQATLEFSPAQTTVIPPGCQATWTALTGGTHLVLPSGRPLPLPARADVSLIAGEGDAYLQIGVGEILPLPSGSETLWTATNSRAQLSLPTGETCELPRRSTLSVVVHAEPFRVDLTRRPVYSAFLRAGECARLRVTAPTTVHTWACTCGSSRCRARHRLASWDPAGNTLENFIASAVKGPTFPIRTKGFTEGMYYPLLAQAGFSGEGPR